MKEYRKIFKFNFRNNTYNMYLDNNNKHFFLKTDKNDNLYYVTMKELLELTRIFTEEPSGMNAIFDFSQRKIKLIPKVMMNGMAVTLSLALLTSCTQTYNEMPSVDEVSQSTLASQILDEETAKSFVSTDSTEELAIDTYKEGTALGYLYIYDMDYIDKAFDDSVSLEDIHDAIDSNSSISPRFKELLYEFSDSVVSKYPDAELRVFYENLKTLELIECASQQELPTTNKDAYGHYDLETNKMYLLKNYDYEKGSIGYEIAFHEFGHCLRKGVYDQNGTEVKVKFCGQNYSNPIAEEALNTLFTVSLLDYEEDTLTYQLQSNYYSVMLECMDNYDLSDYVNHSLTYYAHQLDEYNGDENYATEVLELIRAQYIDYHNPEISAEQSEYYPIYDYLCKMYFEKYITDDMSYGEALTCANQLVHKITHLVPLEYDIDVNHFYDNLNDYCDSIGIQVSSRTR